MALQRTPRSAAEPEQGRVGAEMLTCINCGAGAAV
jgi:hypothetical protein